MIIEYAKITLLACHLFIIAFWAFTSRGRNIESIVGTWKHIQSVPIVTFELLGLIQILFFSMLYMPIFPIRDDGMTLFGLALAIMGTAFAAWAKWVMGTSWGRPAQHDKARQQTLVTQGPFRYSRNPIYVGLFLVFLGQQIAFQSFGILWIILFTLAIRQAVAAEEQLLKRHFGKRYQAYRTRVPRYI